MSVALFFSSFRCEGIPWWSDHQRHSRWWQYVHMLSVWKESPGRKTVRSSFVKSGVFFFSWEVMETLTLTCIAHKTLETGEIFGCLTWINLIQFYSIVNLSLKVLKKLKKKALQRIFKNGVNWSCHKRFRLKFANKCAAQQSNNLVKGSIYCPVFTR